MPAYIVFHSLIDEFSGVTTPLLAVFELVLFMIVPRGLPVHYYAFYAIQKVHFIITLISLGPQNVRYNEVAVYMHWLFDSMLA